MPTRNPTCGTPSRNPTAISAEIETAIELEAEAAANLTRARRRVELLISAATQPAEPRPAEPARLTRSEYARRENVSEATVSRWIADDMPCIPVGSTVRIDPVAADEWRRARGRRPTVASKRTSDVDVATELAHAGLRVVGGGR